ncbi:MAG: fibronectin type III domain-containing protein, partial [Saprospiraceae bacterium]
MNKITTLFLVLLPIFSFAQNIKVGPFLQDAEPTSMYIVWETDADASSIVHFGLDSNLVSMAQGSSFVNMGQNKIHEVQLTGLLPNTRYFY